jgi:hypothetical protein
MSEPSETGGRPLASTTIPLPEGNTKAPSLRRKRTTSQSSDERVGGTLSSSSRRRPGTRKDTSSLGPHTGSSRGDSSTMQRSASPTHMSPEMSSVNYTRTGRISKAKKGLKVHNCECGRVRLFLFNVLSPPPAAVQLLQQTSTAPGLAEHDAMASPPPIACTMLFELRSPRSLYHGSPDTDISV